MRILFSPQVRDNEKIIYAFTDRTIKATHNGISDTFDFSNFSDGDFIMVDDDGFELIETTLVENPICKAEIKDGILSVVLINYINTDSTKEECFPEWIEHTEYVPPTIKEDTIER